MAQKIFIVGCGRSGTHWLGRIITSNPVCAGTVTDVDKKEGSLIVLIRNWCEQGIYYPNKLDSVLPKIYHAYNKYQRKYYPRHYADKTHGAIWIADSLLYMFPHARFIGIERNALPTITSLIHRNSSMRTRRSGNRWKKFSIPTGPSGITHTIAEYYHRLSMYERATLVWIAHRAKMEQMKRMIKDQLLVVSYEKLIRDLPNQLRLISNFLGFKVKANKESVPDTRPNRKWKKEIPAKEVDKINNLLNRKDIREEMQYVVSVHLRKRKHIRSLIN